MGDTHIMKVTILTLMELLTKTTTLEHIISNADNCAETLAL
jgi:hypothetical protein